MCKNNYINYISAVIVILMIVSVVTVPVVADDALGYATLYSDLDPSAWYYKDVDYALYYRFMQGTDRDSEDSEKKLFLPDESLTREQFVTILHRVSSSMPSYGAVEVKHFKDVYEYTSSFSDVDTSAWYRTGLMWAEAYGITKGVSDNEFGIGRTITREEMATLIVRFNDMLSLISLPEADDAPESFNDSHEFSAWAKAPSSK